MTTGSRRERLPNAHADESELIFEPMNHPGHLVRRLHQICVAVFLDAAKEYNLTHVQYATLQAIKRFPDIDQARVGKLVALDRQTVSNVVNRLSQNGLIERKAKDKRTNALQITGAARALIEVMQPRIQTVDEIILGPLSVDERETLMVLLKKLVDSNNELSRAPQAVANWRENAAEQAQGVAPGPQRSRTAKAAAVGVRVARVAKARA